MMPSDYRGNGNGDSEAEHDPQKEIDDGEDD